MDNPWVHFNWSKEAEPAGCFLLSWKLINTEGSVFLGFSFALLVVPWDQKARRCARLQQRLRAMCHLAHQHWQNVYLDIQEFIMREAALDCRNDGVGTDPRIILSGLPTHSHRLSQRNIKCGKSSSPPFLVLLNGQQNPACIW